MYDYMKALQKRFDRQPHPDLDAQVEYAQEELRRDMDATGDVYKRQGISRIKSAVKFYTIYAILP